MIERSYRFLSKALKTFHKLLFIAHQTKRPLLRKKIYLEIKVVTLNWIFIKNI
jgi:hypothetical protein